MARYIIIIASYISKWIIIYPASPPLLPTPHPSSTSCNGNKVCHVGSVSGHMVTGACLVP